MQQWGLLILGILSFDFLARIRMRRLLHIEQYARESTT